MKRGTVLITGAAGFLGSHLCDRFMKEGYRVIGVDDLSTGNLCHVEHHLQYGFRNMIQDVNQPISLRDDIDQILHVASSTSGFLNLLELAKQKGARLLLVTSADTPADVLRFQEAQRSTYQLAHGVQSQVARVYHAYGPRLRLRDPRVIPTFIRQALLGEDLPVYGDGSDVRNFCYVDDVVEAIFRLLDSGYSAPVDIAGKEAVSIKELAQDIQLLSGKDIALEFLPERGGSSSRRVPNLLKTKTILDWEPQVSRSMGLLRTYAYFQHMYEQAHN